MFHLAAGNACCARQCCKLPQPSTACTAGAEHQLTVQTSKLESLQAQAVADQQHHQETGRSTTACIVGLEEKLQVALAAQQQQQQQQPTQSTAVQIRGLQDKFDAALTSHKQQQQSVTQNSSAQMKVLEEKLETASLAQQQQQQQNCLQDLSAVDASIDAHHKQLSGIQSQLVVLQSAAAAAAGDKDTLHALQQQLEALQLHWTDSKGDDTKLQVHLILLSSSRLYPPSFSVAVHTPVHLHIHDGPL